MRKQCGHRLIMIRSIIAIEEVRGVIRLELGREGGKMGKGWE